MPIRLYEPGDEDQQASIYNTAAGSLPGFKPAKAEEISRRYQAADFDPGSRFYAVENGEVVGYSVFGENGRISYPWCLAGAEAWRERLLEAVLAEMGNRSHSEAWAAYRADWSPVLEFLGEQGFREKRAMINYVGELSGLPRPDHLPSDRSIEPLRREELPEVLALAPSLFSGADAPAIERYFWKHAYYRFPENLFALKESKSGEILGVYVLVIDDRFADPTKIDAAMPCFRLGAFGTERERHKRVNGLFSCVFADEGEGELMMKLEPVWSKASEAGLTHIAAQAPSDAPGVCALYDRHLQRQGAFPILTRSLGD
ncbi:MAG TPA: hypothetical protein VKA15_00815 [Isosphaeraceae bacterium]|nr:hypothetical protein [Isosphaeraceae bacterium]